MVSFVILCILSNAFENTAWRGSYASANRLNREGQDLLSCRSWCNSPTQPASVGGAGLGDSCGSVTCWGCRSLCLNMKFIRKPGPAHEVKVVLLWLDSEVGVSCSCLTPPPTPSHQMPSSPPPFRQSPWSAHVSTERTYKSSTQLTPLWEPEKPCYGLTLFVA